MFIGLNAKCLLVVFFLPLVTDLEICRLMLIHDSPKLCPSGAELFAADRRTDKPDKTTVIAQYFCERF